MRKRMFWMLCLVGIVLGSVFLYKMVVGIFIKKALQANQSPIIPVSVMQAQMKPWQSQLKVVGNVRAVKGVDVTTELAGMVQKIYFKPGAHVQEGEILVQLNADTELGQLQSLEAQVALAAITYERDQKQFAINAISKQTLDTDLQNLKSIQGQVKEQAATVAKKTIRAPFSGQLGINNVNPGQYINPGDAITALQTLDPIYLDFYVPQQVLNSLKVGLPILVTTDTYPGRTFSGRITTINPVVSTASRNVLVEATLANEPALLIPGMFTNVTILIGKPKLQLTLPQSAITYNPYGDIIYIVEDKGKDKQGPILIVHPTFVVTGETRGDDVAILKGLKDHATIVTSGQLKLKNESRVTINNTIAPSDSPAPIAPNQH